MGWKQETNNIVNLYRLQRKMRNGDVEIQNKINGLESRNESYCDLKD